MHSSAIGGHTRISVTYRHAKQNFAWPGMKSAIHAFVFECQLCQQAKPDRSKLPGLLQPLLVPERAWKVVSLDFAKGCHCMKGITAFLW
jgi:hypothetical protein